MNEWMNRKPWSCSSIELSLVVDDGGDDKWIGDDDSFCIVKQSEFGFVGINGWRRYGDRKWFRNALE